MSSIKHKIICQISVLSLLIVITFFSPQVLAQNSSSINLFSTTEKPFGLSYEDHVINYWKFIIPIQTELNPAEDTTGQRCKEGQNVSESSIFYLHGNSGGLTEKTCEIPSGLGLFIPIIQAESSTAESPKASVDDLRNIVKEDQDSVNLLSLTINEKEYGFDELKKYRVPTKEFLVEFPENNIFGGEEGVHTAIADGYQVITSPLTPGNYEIHFKGSLPCYASECQGPNFVTDNIYHLIVK